MRKIKESLHVHEVNFSKTSSGEGFQPARFSAANSLTSFSVAVSLSMAEALVEAPSMAAYNNVAKLSNRSSLRMRFT